METSETRVNLSKVLGRLLAGDRTTRTELADVTGLRPATVNGSGGRSSRLRPRIAASLGFEDRALAVSLAILRLGPVLVILVVIGVMTALSPLFLTGRNTQDLMQQMGVVAMLSMGQLMVILVRGIDISVGSVVSLSAVVAVTLVGANGWLGIPLMLATGAAIGAINGLVIVKGGISQPLVVTLASLGAGAGLALLITGGQIRNVVPAAVSWAGSAFAGPVPVPFLIVIVFAVILYLLTAKTTWGRWTYAVGGNPEAARRLGIPVDRIVITSYVLCGTLAGVAGILSAGRTGTADPTAGTDLELQAITAAVIGGASLFGGRGSIGGALVGAATLTVIGDGLNLKNVSPYWQTITLGVIVVIALELDAIRRRVEERLRVRQTRRRA